jgi:DNA-binding transcriptional LysR family regulator
VNFRTLDLNLLRVFDAVMAEGSLTRAAETLSLTQPAVSHALRRLHQSVGAELLVRTAHGMRPTAQGEALWPQVRAALDSLELAIAPQAFLPRSHSANFHLAMADSTAATLAPGLVRIIESERALANLRVLPLTTRDPRQLLESGDVDLAIGYFPATLTRMLAEGSDSPLRHALLYEADYRCIMRRDHPLARAPLTVDAFCAAHHLLVSFSGRAHGFVDEALTALGRRRRIVLTVNQFFTAGRVVTRSDLLTVMPDRFIAATGYADQLVSQPLPMEVGRIQVAMLWHARKDRSAAHQWLREQVRLVVASDGQDLGEYPPSAAIDAEGAETG